MTRPDASPSPPTSDAASGFAGELARLAKSDITVLIEGEHGSGKSRAARALHDASARAGGPCVTVDLAALSPTLLEAELFGHEAGAFTGADRQRTGRFRRAQGGTLVLEGIEGLPAELQPKLLRALQERTIEPLGAEASVAVDARVVATSGLDLAAEVREGRFREDLYYRLAVVVLRVPPLRSRRADLLPLVEELRAFVAERLGVAPREIDREALERLAAHSWPGNVRELENALERVSVLVPPGAGPVELDELAFLDDAVAGAETRLAREALAHGLTLDALSLALLESALEEQRGNLSAAARAVGLSRRAFEYRLQKLRDGGDSPEQQEAAG